jgi:putative FmdB family regulatory protein
MPIYEYRCETCGHLYEEFVRFGEDPDLKCPECGGLEASKVVSLFGSTGAGANASSSASAAAACAPSGG